MGNHCCAIRHRGSSPSAVWADDEEWGPMTQGRPMEKEGLLNKDDQIHQGYSNNLSSVDASTGGQVRIWISKKQLDELLKKVDESGAQTKKIMKVDQALLQRLIDESDDLEIHHDHDHHYHHQRPWKPALQSIPEVN